MSDGIYSALSGAIAQERNLSVAANNVANVNTTGYRADKTVFSEVMTKVKNQQPLQPSLRYAAVNQLSLDMQHGSLQTTGRPLDVALQGDAWFVVQTPQGERYTKAGSFITDQQGILRTPAGNAVLQDPRDHIDDPGQPIRIPEQTREIKIQKDGEIWADGGYLAKLKLARFDNPDDSLQREGLTLFKTQDGFKPQPVTPFDPLFSVEQGYLESANVNAVSGLNELITLNRAFAALEKVIETYKDLDDRTARDVGGRV
jgi:flagellar basal-body rod protein FlgF